MADVECRMSGALALVLYISKSDMDFVSFWCLNFFSVLLLLDAKSKY